MSPAIDRIDVTRISGADRIVNLDVLRGLAILFILFMNIQYMGDFADPDYFPRAISWTWFDRATWWFNRLLDGTQRGLLELLFGAGVLIMARTAMVPEGPVAVADLHLRRNMWLMLFGVLHGVVLLWPGDILLSYGTAALLVFPFRRLRVRWLLVIGIAVNALLLMPAIDELRDRQALVTDVVGISARAATGTPPGGADQAVLARWKQAQADVTAPDPAKLARTRAAMLGAWPAYATELRGSWAYVQFTGIGIYWENIAEAFGTMLIGMALFKTGVIQGGARTRLYVGLLLGGYGIGLAARIPATIAELRFDALPDIGWVSEAAVRLPLTIGHLAAVTLALGTARGRRWLAPLVAPGQMPLTIYLSASLMAILVFGGPFLGLWNSMGFGRLWLVAVVTIAAQIICANLWLRHFASGPVEWLWKSLAYVKLQPFRRTP